MSIINNLKRTEAAVALSNFKGQDLGKQIGDAAVAAIMKGIGTEEWTQYMSLFCDTKEELQRLTVPDSQNDPPYMPQIRAYIVANAVCAGNTGTRTSDKVNQPIEPLGLVAAQGIEDPAVVRERLGFAIPQVQ